MRNYFLSGVAALGSKTVGGGDSVANLAKKRGGDEVIVNTNVLSIIDMSFVKNCNTIKIAKVFKRDFVCLHIGA